MCKTNGNFEKFEIAVKRIYTVRATSELMISTTFAMVSMMRITGVEYSNKSKCAKQTAISKSFKRFKSDIHIVRHVRNDDLNYVCHG